MERGRHAQLGAATGILAVILLIVGFSVFSSDIPDADASAQQWLQFFSDHQDRIQTGLTVAGVGIFFFIWFLGSLRDAIAGAEGGTGRLASVAHGGGIVASVGFVIGLAGFLTAAFHPAADPQVIHAFADFGSMCAAPAAAGFVALFAATAVAGYRHGAFPAWVAGISALAAIGQAFAYGTALSDSGAFAPDGVFGLWVPFFTFAIAVIALSGSMISRAGQQTAEAQTQTAA